ncbi:glutathione peroxidase 3-like [Protopterus annectens]|uniref:glutathione peroxidase 3-like n=1 Tax=Protopterus annectens TaxID=7888 RepID=UPI001CFA2F24|nr:glutathione peroxidase 3-like [Protopterus annectens]
MGRLAGTDFTVLGFPCNQFGLQSPENSEEILNLLKHVRPGNGFVPRFPIFGKTEVNGGNGSPLYKFLKESCPFINPSLGDRNKLYWTPLTVNDIRWNFEKFLIDGYGVPYSRQEKFVQKVVEMCDKQNMMETEIYMLIKIVSGVSGNIALANIYEIKDNQVSISIVD